MGGPHGGWSVCERQLIVVCHLGWNELLVASLAYQSTATNDCIMLTRGLCVYRSNAHQLGFGLIFDRILAELVYKMRELVMDRTELGCLRAVVLFNPGKLLISRSLLFEGDSGSGPVCFIWTKITFVALYLTFAEFNLR